MKRIIALADQRGWMEEDLARESRRAFTNLSAKYYTQFFHIADDMR